jgi:hypothetical protein
MHFFIITFLCLINLMINKYTSHITVQDCWNTAVCKQPTERKYDPHCKNG